MRWVDIDKLEFSDGWQAKADKALDELRKEITNAELAAQLAGENVATARKAAITNGLNKSARKQIWRDLAPQLAKLQNGKCWYSESQNPGSDKDIDHFRPKNRVAEDPDHEGYGGLPLTGSTTAIHVNGAINVVVMRQTRQMAGNGITFQSFPKVSERGKKAIIGN